MVALASATEPPCKWASASPATAVTAADSWRRRLSCQGVGHTTMQAVTQNTAAKAHPNSRGPMAAAGWATATGNTKSKSAAVDAVAT